jgi:hypothetical protein
MPVTDLDLHGCTGVTDLSSLAKLVRLRRLNVSNCPFADEGVKNLQEALPNCKIEH